MPSWWDKRVSLLWQSNFSAPRSTAVPECLLSMVRKIKTSHCGSLLLSSTVASGLSVKPNTGVEYYNSNDHLIAKLLTSAKSATERSLGRRQDGYGHCNNC